MSLVKKREKWFKKQRKEFFKELKIYIEDGRKNTIINKEQLEYIGLEISDVAYFLLKHNITSTIVFFIKKNDSPHYVINFYDSGEEYKRSIEDINKKYEEEKDGELLFENGDFDFYDFSLENKRYEFYQFIFYLAFLIILLGTFIWNIIRG